MLLATAILFSTSGAGIKDASFTAAQVTSLRSGIAAIALLLWMRGQIAWSLRAAGIGVFYATMVILFVTSTKLTTSANAIFIQGTAPLYLLVLAPRFLGERLRSRDLVYVAALAAGMVLCFIGEPQATSLAPNPVLGNLLAIGCGFTWAITLLSLRLVERHGAQPGTGLTAAVAGNVLACLVMLPASLPLPSASPVAWATILYLGIVQLALGYICLTSAIRHVPALDASLLLLLEPVLNPIWTWLLRGERPEGWAIVGGGVIIFATALKALSDESSDSDDGTVEPHRQ